MIINAMYEIDCEYLNDSNINNNNCKTVIVECKQDTNSNGYFYYSFLNIYPNGKQELNIRRINNIVGLINENEKYFVEIDKNSDIYCQFKETFMKIYKELNENENLIESIKGLKFNV